MIENWSRRVALAVALSGRAVLSVHLWMRACLVDLRTCVRVCMSVSLHVCLPACLSVCQLCVCVCVCVCVCMCVTLRGLA